MGSVHQLAVDERTERFAAVREKLGTPRQGGVERFPLPAVYTHWNIEEDIDGSLIYESGSAPSDNSHHYFMLRKNPTFGGLHVPRDFYGGTDQAYIGLTVELAFPDILNVAREHFEDIVPMSVLLRHSLHYNPELLGRFREEHPWSLWPAAILEAKEQMHTYRLNPTTVPAGRHFVQGVFTYGNGNIVQYDHYGLLGVYLSEPAAEPWLRCSPFLKEGQIERAQETLDDIVT